MLLVSVYGRKISRPFTHKLWMNSGESGPERSWPFTHATHNRRLWPHQCQTCSHILEMLRILQPRGFCLGRNITQSLHQGAGTVNSRVADSDTHTAPTGITVFGECPTFGACVKGLQVNLCSVVFTILSLAELGVYAHIILTQYC